MSSEAMEVNEARPRYLAGTKGQDVPPGYKRTEVGVIPEDWNCLSIGSIAASERNAIVGGPFGSDLVSKDYVEHGVPVIRGQNMEGQWIAGPFVFVTPAKAKSLSANLARPGDIVFTQRGTLGQVSLIPEQPFDIYLVSQSQMKVTLNRELVDPVFLFYVFRGPAHQQVIREGTIQTGVPHINLGILRAIPVQAPSIGEQRAIAEALSDVDGLLEALEALVAKKRAIKQAAMQQLLTGKTRLPGFSGEWETVHLGDIADKRIPFSFAGGPFGSNLKASEYATSGVRILQLQNIGDGVFNDDYAIFTSEEKADELRACNIFPGEIIMSKMGDPVARACLVPSQDKRYLMASDGIRLSVDRKRYSTEFVLYYINFAEFRSKAIDASTGSTRMRIALNTLKRLPFRAPELHEQTAIATVLSDMDGEIAALEARRDKTRAIKQGMMQQLLTGRVRLVKPSPAEAGA